MAARSAKRWLISGMVQGVGFRYFVQKRAAALGISGWARNLSDGRVEVYGAGPLEALSDLAGSLHKGPPMSDVRSVEEMEAALEPLSGFEVK
jgi:acylphosphatase